jgi:hypothetical protein
VHVAPVRPRRHRSEPFFLPPGRRGVLLWAVGIRPMARAARRAIMAGCRAMAPCRPWTSEIFVKAPVAKISRGW